MSLTVHNVVSGPYSTYKVILQGLVSIVLISYEYTQWVIYL